METIKKIIIIFFISLNILFAQEASINKYFSDYTNDYKFSIIKGTMVVDSLTNYTEKEVSFILTILDYYLIDNKIKLEDIKTENIKFNFNGTIIEINNQLAKEYYSKKLKDRTIILQKGLTDINKKIINTH